MSRRVTYKGRIILSSPLPLSEGGFSTNGQIEIHTDAAGEFFRSDGLQDRIFPDEEQADEFYITGAVQIIDNGIF